MPVKSGAGAAVASGADFQSRVGAYLVALDFVDFSHDLTAQSKICNIGFETGEAIDDIAVELANGAQLYIQAKSNVQYTLKKRGELRSVLTQFMKQYHRNNRKDVRFLLITGNSSSRTVTQVMRAALEAYRLSPKGQFHRDQPQSVLNVIDDLSATLAELQRELGELFDENEIGAVLKRIGVVCLDLEPGNPLELSTVQLLGAAGYAMPSVVWGKLISDCLHYAKNRQTIRVADLASDYNKYKMDRSTNNASNNEEFIQIIFNETTFEVGREVALVRFPAVGGPLIGNVILETYRFDANCDERSEFKGNSCRLLNGQRVELFRRAATFSGLMRLIENHPAIAGQKITIAQINSKEDFEASPCAELHRDRLRRAFAANLKPLTCLHCGEGIFSNTAQVVECGPAYDIKAGLCHLECLQSDDRVLGGISNELFEQHPELVNFDINGWAKAVRFGPHGYAGMDVYRSRTVHLGWSGHCSRAHNGRYIVEIQLEGGTSLYARHRGRVHRLTSAEADELVASTNRKVANNTADPPSYSSESWESGNHSALLSRFGGSEKILKVIGARKVRYNINIDLAFSMKGNWYTPICYLRERSTSEAVQFLDSVPLIRNPWHLRNYLDNWKSAGIAIPDYEVATLVEDANFDDFLLRVFKSDLTPIVDPLLMAGDQIKLMSGAPIVLIP